jgi:HEAT repeat protein
MIQVAEYIEKLSSDDEADRIYAAEDIGYANDPAGIGPLLARLPIEHSRAVREAIVGALLQIEDDSVISGVIEWLDSEDPFLRNQGVEILRRRGPKAIPYLEKAFRAGDADRRKFIIDVLAKLRDSGTSEVYDLALSDPDLNVVIAAVESLGDTRNAALHQRIENLVSSDAHPMLLCACLEALARIGEPASLEVVRVRLGALAELPGYFRPSYIKLLGAAGHAKDAAEIAGMIENPGLEAPALNALTLLRNRYPGLELPESLVKPLAGIVSRNGPSLLGYQAVRLLAALLHEEEAFDFVERCLEHPDKTIRIAAIQSLRESGGEHAEDLVRRFLAAETDEEVLQAAGIEGIE